MSVDRKVTVRWVAKERIRGDVSVDAELILNAVLPITADVTV